MKVPSRGSAWRAILAGGLAAGVLDLMAALSLYGLRGARPIRIVQAIASGLMGAEAFKGGLGTAALGCLLHFFIATSAAAVYVSASRWIEVLVRRPIVSGVIYGVVVYAVMNFVVLPLSAVARSPFDPRLALILVAIHMLCVGLPIALAARRFAR
jgi:hypothetical protein